MATEAMTERESQLNRDIEIAKAAQRSVRQDAPSGITVGSVFKDPRIRQLYRLVSEAFGKSKNPKVKELIPGGVGSTMDGYFGNVESYRSDLAAGWEPVVEAGEHQQQGGQLLYKRPKSIGDYFRKMPAEVSRKRLEVLDGESTDNPLMAEFRRNPSTGGDRTEVTQDNIPNLGEDK